MQASRNLLRLVEGAELKSVNQTGAVVTHLSSELDGGRFHRIQYIVVYYLPRATFLYVSHIPEVYIYLIVKDIATWPKTIAYT